MPTNDPQFEARTAELKAAPPNVRRVVPLALTLGALMFCSYAASALAHHIGWGRAILGGVVQIVFYSTLAAVTVMERKKWGWVLLLILVATQTFFASGSAMRLIRAGFSNPFFDTLIDLIATARFLLGITLLLILISKDVRNRAWATKLT